MTVATRSATLAAVGVAAALVLGGCAGGGGGKNANGATTNAAPVAAPDAAATTLALEAHEFSLSPKDLRSAPGAVSIRYTNAGAIQHTLMIEGVSGFKLDVPNAGDVDTGTARLRPGTYTLYCDVPGHRSAGMEAQLTVG
jgi:plastocyanin